MAEHFQAILLLLVFLALATIAMGAMAAMSFTEDASARPKDLPDQASCHRSFPPGPEIGRCAFEAAGP